MRVISGSLKGRVIKGFDIEGTRPTMDRVKESIFGSIQDRVSDALVLDLFAGSGNLGIEAISNGCSYCYFVDNNKKCINVIDNNLRGFGVEGKSTSLYLDYSKALDRFRDKRLVFDIIFVDPPYRKHIINDVIKSVREYGLLRSGGVIVLEYDYDSLDSDIEGYLLLKKKKYGDKYVSIYEFL